MQARVLLLLALSACFTPSIGHAQELQKVSPGGGRFEIGGYAELQMRGLSDGFDANNWYLSQWAWILNLEPEWNIAPDGFGPFDTISAFARIEVRYECVWTGCGLANTWRYFGNRATRAPAHNWGDGLTERFEGPIDLPALGIPVKRIQSSDEELRNILSSQHTARGLESGVPLSTLEAAFGPRIDDLFTYKRIDGAGVGGVDDTLALPLGPWRPESKIRPNGSLAALPSHVIGLPFRPESSSRYVPSAELRRHLDEFDSFDQNFRQTELEWNHGASQDEWELKEAYVDFEMFDSRLWIRAGKQNIVWGKTELFRTTDQFNPVDLALASLPSLEESRIALWSVRGIWSFYDVGPLQDVRLELAMNYDDFEPIDLGRCGEPYAVWLVCGKTTALWGHGVVGIGIAGEERPPDPWDSARGIEFGARLEFRWGPLSFALTDFYGYDDFPALELFNSYSRGVDSSGRPLDAYGRPLREDTALAASSGNRTLFEAACEGSLGFPGEGIRAFTGGEGIIPDVTNQCYTNLSNLQDPFIIEASISGLELEIEATFANVAGAALAGQFGGNLLVDVAINGIDQVLANLGSGTIPAYLVPLNVDPADGPKGGGLFGSGCTLALLCGLADSSNVSMYLTDQQEALLGCGRFYRTDCDVDGLDLFHAEASVLLQSFAGFEGNPIATRFQDGKLFVLPGARGPGDPGYDRRIDGTPPRGFHSEMAAVSANFKTYTALAGFVEGSDDNCNIEEPDTCATVRGLVTLTGSQRPELRAGGNGKFGRRDFIWHGGGEALLFYPKRNVLGLSFDFGEDLTKTNWGVEFTWVNDVPFASNTSRNLLQETDVYNLTVSVDRPTFVNFLNANRTFFLNAQLFVRYLPHFDSSYDTNGPLTALGTFAITTGYFQDRLLPSLVLIHDLKSASGGVIAQFSYRFNESFSLTVGMLSFYGRPRENRIPYYPIALTNANYSTDSKTGMRFEGLSAIAERDEAFLSLRYTF